MSNKSHLQALIKKNLLIYKSTFILTIVELLFPALVIFLFWKLRKLFKIRTFTIEDDEDYYFDEGILISHFESNIYYDDLRHYKFYAYCSNANKFIAIIGDDFPKEYLNYTENITLFHFYSSIKELNDYIESKDYGTDRHLYPKVCFGITFKNSTNKYTFKLHFFASPYAYYTPQIPSTNIKSLDPFATVPDLRSYYKYAFQGFLYVEKLLFDLILKKETKNPLADITFRVVPQKYEIDIDDYFSYFLNMIIGFFMLIAYALPLSINIYRLVKEKESRVKEGMKIMGLKESTYFLSYFIIYLFFNLVYAICNTFLLKKAMFYIEKFYLFIFFYLLGLMIYSLIYFFQSFLDKTRLAIIVSLLIYCLMYFFSFSVNSNVPSRLTKYILCIIFPPITMQLGLNTFSYFETNFNKFNGRIFMKYNKFCIFDMYILFIINFITYLFIGFYIQNIISHEFGLKKKWYFLCTRSYWGCEKKQKIINNKIMSHNKIESGIKLNIVKNNNNNNEVKYNSMIKHNIVDESKSTDKTGLSLIPSKSHISILNTSVFNKNGNNGQNIYSNQEKNNNKDVIIEKKEENENENAEYEEKDFFENNVIYQDYDKEEDIIQIKDIHKIFGDKKVALKGVSFNLYRNEIFALLGHNGAGKSTLINILTGLYSSTSGSAFYDSYNILTPDGLEKFRKVLGICPQHDVLFNELTVEDHLEMFCVFKSINNCKIDKEITKVLHDLGLEEKRHTKVKNLSGGQKRKLSIAIALVGGSSVIFLDEPTSGMDISSRRNLWNVLKRCLNGKIIILTTHYMEEASVLGNRIGILSEGTMQCIGSPLFLIEKFGKNLNINITKKVEANNNEIINFIKINAGNDLKIEYEIFNEEILFRIPKEDYNFNSKELFIKLDQELENLKIKSYSISMSTLEDVFINISKIMKRKKMSKEEYEKEESEKEKTLEKNSKILYDNNNYHEKYSCCTKILRDTKVSFKKRLFQIYRDKKTFFLEILCPILLTFIGCIVGSLDILEKNETIPFLMNQITNDSQIIYYSTTVRNSNQTIINEIFSKYSSEDTSKVKFEYIDFEKENYVTTDGIKFMKEIYDIKHVKNKIKNNYVGYLFTRMNTFLDRYEFTYFPDTISRQSTAIYANYLLKNIVRYASKNDKLEIEVINEPLPYTKEEKCDKQNRNNIIILFFISLAFSLIPANFITILIKERENNSKHLQIISGISLFSYWFNNYIFELLKYYIIGGICIFLIFYYDYYKKYLVILYLLYGPAMVSFTYLFSFIFKTEDKGQTSILLINLLVGTLGGSAILIMRLNDELVQKARVLAYIFRIIPSFCFCYGYNVLLNEENLEYGDYYFYDILDIEYVTSDFIFLASETFIYLLLLILFENSDKLFRICYTTSKPNKKSKEKTEQNNNENNNNNLSDISIPDNVNDSYVKNEIIKSKKTSENEKYAMKIQSLIKTFYGGPFGFKIFSLCFKQTRAVRNLSFCLDYGECFGFLGINGAGKTTTFKCLSNEIFPTSGNIFIDNKNINKNFDSIRSLIGYCPQFDAIFDFLTVYENLEFYGLIKGAKKEKIKDIINALIEEMNLLKFKNKIAGSLSGGNKRKLSVAISLICNPPIILLDEPSTGMDPEARRFMWGVIHRVSLNQKKSTIIMTTHSMEEAETLCKRIGILVDGQFKCLSTSDEIKEKYGYGYEINLQIKKPEINILYEKYCVSDEDKKKEIHYNCIEECMKLYNFEEYYTQIKRNLFGGKIFEELEIYQKISFNKILYWIYYLDNFFQIVNVILDNFPEIFCTDYSDNNFVISIKKVPNKSIGFLFCEIEDNKERCNIEQYNLKLTSLEQIFNKFEREKEKQIEDKNENENDVINIRVDKELISHFI